jgi:hypothetical protein
MEGDLNGAISLKGEHLAGRERGSLLIGANFSVRSGGIDYADDDSRQRCRKWAKLPVGKRLDIAAERVLGGS